MEKLDNTNNIEINKLYTKIVEKIEIAKRNVVSKINSEMTILYWNIGKDISENILDNNKPEYGKSIIKNLSQRLTIEYGRGYSRANIFRMLKLYESFSDFTIFSTVSRKLS